MNSNGYVVATWGEYNPPALTSTLKASISIDFGASWGSVTTIDAANPSEGTQLLFPDIALDSSNRAIIVWNIWSDPPVKWQVKVTPYGASAISVQTLDAAAADFASVNPHIAMNDSLDAIAIWYYQQATNQWVVRRSISSDGGASGKRRELGA